MILSEFNKYRFMATGIGESLWGFRELNFEPVGWANCCRNWPRSSEQERSELSTFCATLIHRAAAMCAAGLCILVHQCMIWYIVDPFAISFVQKHLNSVIVKVFISENRKPPSYVWSIASFVIDINFQNGLPCNIARWSMFPNMYFDSYEFSSVFTRAWNILPGYFFIFAGYIYISVYGPTFYFCWVYKHQCIRAATWQNQQSDCAPSEYSDQPRLISCALNG